MKNEQGWQELFWATGLPEAWLASRTGGIHESFLCPLSFSKESGNRPAEGRNTPEGTSAASYPTG